MPGTYQHPVDHEFTGGRLFLRRTPEGREPVLQRLRRIEDQVRGPQRMLEQDRHRLDELQPANAVIVAMRKAALLICGQHMTAGVEHVARRANTEAVLEEVEPVLRPAIRKAG